MAYEAATAPVPATRTRSGRPSAEPTLAPEICSVVCLFLNRP
ncbi:hypothetical protein ACFZCY_11150 [Streptomyces sp. NPDC007983]